MRKFALLSALLLGITLGSASAQTNGRRGERTTAPISAASSRPSTSQDQLTLVLTKAWVGGAWRDTSRTRYTTYDAVGNLRVRVTESRTGATWTPINQRRFTFNGQRKVTNDTLFSYNATTGIYRPLIATYRTYTAAGKIDSVVRLWRPGAAWGYYSRDIFAYDANDFPQQELWQSFVGGWLNDAQFLFITDARGNIINEEYQPSNFSGTGWLEGSLSERIFDTNDSLLTQTVSEWDTLTLNYELSSRTRVRYGSLGLVDSAYFENYDRTSNTWQLAEVWTYAYDSRQNRTEWLRQLGTSLGSLTNFQRVVYSWTIVTGRPDEVLAATAPTLAPNPTAGFATLRYDLTSPSTVSVEVLDNLGRRVSLPLTATAQRAGSHEVQLDVRALPAGLYVARLRAGTATRQLKLVVQ